MRLLASAIYQKNGVVSETHVSMNLYFNFVWTEKFILLMCQFYAKNYICKQIIWGVNFL